MSLQGAAHDTLHYRRTLTKKGRCCFCEKEGGAVRSIVASLMGRGAIQTGLRCCDECLDKYVWDWEQKE